MDATSISFVNCSALASRTNLGSYIQILNATTGFNETLIEACKSNICNALWGTGNADISGIGVSPSTQHVAYNYKNPTERVQMIAGYFLASALGLFFALAFLFLRPLAKELASDDLLAAGLAEFFNCAVFFSASIQIACVVVLARKDFGISANGLGGLTVQITWTVALLCMLPLLYPMIILEYTNKEKRGYRIFLFCGCWLLFLYVFLSMMVAQFAPSQVGVGAGSGGSTVITNDEFDILTILCLSGAWNFTTKEMKALSGFNAAGALIISVYGLGLLLYYIILKRGSARERNARASRISSTDNTIQGQERWRRIVLIILLFVNVVLTVPQFWGVIRLRGIQSSLANNTGNVYTDNQWTFGQVVAVMLFAPVFTEVGYLWRKNRQA